MDENLNRLLRHIYIILQPVEWVAFVMTRFSMPQIPDHHVDLRKKKKKKKSFKFKGGKHKENLRFKYALKLI